MAILFQSTLLMRGATRRKSCTGDCAANISIHAPHARSDEAARHRLRRMSKISIHAPHARSDGAVQQSARADTISIHAPHARSDSKSGDYIVEDNDFNPRSSCEERLSAIFMIALMDISIHAPHARSDLLIVWRNEAETRNFNPRSSCEERQSSLSRTAAGRRFQSTLLMRGATSASGIRHPMQKFQSTLLMRGATAWILRQRKRFEFQSTLLMRGATMGTQSASSRP